MHHDGYLLVFLRLLTCPRSAAHIVAVIVLVVAGCREKQPSGPPALPDRDTPIRTSALVEEAPAVDEEEPEPTVSTSEAMSIKCKHVPLAPRMTWTGSRFAIVWHETKAENVKHIDIEEDVASIYDYLPEMIDLQKVEEYLTCMAFVDGRTALVADPMILEGAGSGPKALDGPAFSLPAWHDGKLALAWSLWNEEVRTGDPMVRYVLGRWGQDGRPVGDPIILSKTRAHHTFIYHAKIMILVTGEDLEVLWLVEKTPREVGCTNEHGISDGLASAKVGPDDTIGIQYGCGDFIDGFDAYRFGSGDCYIQHDAHIASKTWVGCTSGGDGEYFEYENPYQKHLATSGGLAVWSDEYKKGEIVGHCLDIYRPDREKITCARYKGMRLSWDDSGLAVVILTKDGKEYQLPLAPGDRVPQKLLRPELTRNVPFEDAMWSGHSIGLVWTQGKQVKVKLVGRDGLVPVE